MADTKLFINGEWVEAASGETFPSFAPSTGEKIADVAKGGRDDAQRAIEAARKAFNDGPWPKMSGKERAEKNLVYWALARESYIGFAYNKSLVPKDAVPKHFDGLFHPALKSKMGISIGQTSDKIIGAMIKSKGEEMVRKLKAQEMKLYSIDAPALVNTITTGEIVASPAIFQTHTLLAASKGAPVEWVPMDIVPTNVGGAAISAQPPHPHAALLLADYLLGPEGQAVLEKFEYGSAAKNLGFKRWRPDHGIAVEKYEKELARWEKLMKEISHRVM